MQLPTRVYRLTAPRTIYIRFLQLDLSITHNLYVLNTYYLPIWTHLI